MNDQTDSQLLRAYAERHSEPAFAELVRRHVDLVYSAALRMVCDSHLAEDVAQGVFVALAKSAAELTNRPVLSGWLHRTAQNIAAQTVRTDVRRRAREKEAVAMNELLSAEPDANWESIAPQLDAALGELSEPDRDAVLLRYFEKKSAREMAQTLGISDEAAQKRVNRAVERLREFFAKRGIAVGAGGLTAVMSANAVQAAPVGLALTISTGVATLGGAALTLTKAIAMTTLQKTIIAAALTAAIAAAIYQAHEASNLRSQVRELQQALTNQAAAWADGQTETSNRLAGLAEENGRLNRNAAELLKLRADVTRLRREKPVLSAKIPEKAIEDTATNTPPFQTYSTTNHVELNWGQTLVAGGWKVPSGDRALMFATLTPIDAFGNALTAPAAAGRDALQMAVHFKIAEVTEASLQALWPAGLAASDHEPKTGLLDREQYDSFIERLMKAGASTVRDLEMTTSVNRQCQLSIGEKEEHSGLIGLSPQLSADGKKITLEITSSLNFPTTTAPK